MSQFRPISAHNRHAKVAALSRAIIAAAERVRILTAATGEEPAQWKRARSLALRALSRSSADLRAVLLRPVDSGQAKLEK